DGRRLRSELKFGSVVAKDGNQFIANNLDHLFAGRERGHDVLAERLVLDLVDKLFYNLEVDIGFQQSHANLAKRFLDIVFIEDGLAAKALKSALKLFLKIFKHKETVILTARN